MRAGKRIARIFQVVKLCIEPAVHGVAGFARSRELESDVIDDRSQEILLMAGVAVRGQSFELPDRSAFVALCALHHGMRANQREAVLMVLDRVYRDLPTLYRVAALAVCAELTAMNVCVAIRALLADIFEDQAGMTLVAAYFFVHAAQGIPRLVMVELGVGSNWLPTCVSVAILTRDRERTMGIGHLGLGAAYLWSCIIGWLFSRQSDKHGCNKPNGNCNEPARTVHRSPRGLVRVQNQAKLRVAADCAHNLRIPQGQIIGQNCTFPTEADDPSAIAIRVRTLLIDLKPQMLKLILPEAFVSLPMKLLVGFRGTGAAFLVRAENSAILKNERQRKSNSLSMKILAIHVPELDQIC